MLKLDTRVLRILWTLAVCYVVYRLRNVIFLLILSVVAAYMVLPVIEFIYRYVTHYRHRGLALGIVYLLLFAIFVAAGGLIGYYAFQEATSLAQQIPDITQPGAVARIHLPHFLARWDAEIRSQLQVWVDVHGKNMLETLTSVSVKVLTAVSSVLTLLIVLLLSFLLLRNGSSFKNGFLRLLPITRREEADAILREEHVMLVHWTHAVVLTAVGAAALYGIGYSALGVPYSVLLALVVFPFEFVPIIGPIIGFAIVLLVVFFSGYHGALWVILFFLATRVVVDYVIQPYVLGGGSLHLSPFAVIVGAIAGDAVGGVPGVLLSIPVLATIRILYRHLVEKHAAAYAPEIQSA